jgi:hypothetical protein
MALLFYNDFNFQITLNHKLQIQKVEVSAVLDF